jgi:DNA mismatch endonuclease (patch repair protein)
MSRIRGAHTRPERILRTGLHKAGLRYRLHKTDLEGRPDIVLPRHCAVVFVHGCFWHQHPGCRDATSPKTREKFWATKFAQNKLRDERQIAALLSAGWRVLIVWECSLKAARDRPATIATAVQWIRSEVRYSEISRPLAESTRVGATPR